MERKSRWSGKGDKSKIGVDKPWKEFRNRLCICSFKGFCVGALAGCLLSGRGSVRKTLTFFGLGCGIGYACKRAVYDFEPYSPDVTLMKGRQLTPTSAPSGP
ncbi:hypothetical protein BLSTO_05333 [Blastocystis sp. subtype 1]